MTCILDNCNGLVVKKIYVKEGKLKIEESCWKCGKVVKSYYKIPS